MRFVINTHYHFDHTDGNLAFAQGGAVITANDNLRARLASGGIIGNGGSISKEVPAAPAGALPTVTYERELTLHLDGESVRVHHYLNAHTDGDSVVFFANAKVVHMGDIFVRYGFPFIDTNGGGNVRGMIAACDDVLRSVAPDSKGDRGTADLRPSLTCEYAKMLTDTSALVCQGARGRQVARADEAGKTAGCLECPLRPRRPSSTPTPSPNRSTTPSPRAPVRHGPAVAALAPDLAFAQPSGIASSRPD